MNMVVVFPTWKCGLSCSYCAYEQQEDEKSIRYLGSNYLYKVKKELGPEEWIILLKKYEPAFYDFSGGEPLRYKGIEKVLNSLPKWSITSNTLFFNDSIDLSRCAWWTASFHPHIGEAGVDKFLWNIRRIRNAQVGVGITMVAKPETLSKVLMWCNRFSSLGYRVNIHPYYDNADFDWNKYPKEKAILMKSKFLRYDDRLFSFKGISGNGYCNGGKTYFVIGPDGKEFSCLTSMLFNIEDKIKSKPACDQNCFFPCDWYYGKRKVIGEKNE